ncbi:MAG: hypothetical protein ACFB10_10160 [Salibacteraceae bacterium]
MNKLLLNLLVLLVFPFWGYSQVDTLSSDTGMMKMEIRKIDLGQSQTNDTTSNSEPSEFGANLKLDRDREYEGLSIPLELCGQTLFLQKYDPVYLHEIDSLDFKIIGYSNEKLDEYLLGLKVYNQVVYRQLNELLKEFIEENADLKGRVELMGFRDFRESKSSDVRFILQRNFTVSDLLLSSEREEAVGGLEEGLTYSIFDRQNDTVYRAIEDLREFQIMFENYNVLCDNDHLSKFTESDLEESLRNAEYKRYQDYKTSQAAQLVNAVEAGDSMSQAQFNGCAFVGGFGLLLLMVQIIIAVQDNA